MASKFATELSAKLTSGVPENVLEWGRRIIDAELQEVRETLVWLLESKGAYLFHEDECAWQYGPDDCNCRVQRTRALMEKLEVR